MIFNLQNHNDVTLLCSLAVLNSFEKQGIFKDTVSVSKKMLPHVYINHQTNETQLIEDTDNCVFDEPIPIEKNVEVEEPVLKKAKFKQTPLENLQNKDKKIVKPNPLLKNRF
jgi:hypothetical protein